MSPTTLDEFVAVVRQSGLIADRRLDTYLSELFSVHGLPEKSEDLAGLMVRDGLLTFFQSDQLLQGKWKRFSLSKYKILERLGAGGMGEVYLCEHERMSRRVAVKVLPPEIAGTPGALERFEREAKLAASLNHPNIVRAYDFDQDGSTHFIVMEFIDGPTLHELVAAQGPLPVEHACHYVGQAALGLQNAHEAGLVHRDIKPGNIIIDRQGVVKLLDLGLARLVHDEMDQLTRRFNQTGVLGTADYLAPEQGRDSHAVDIRADIYGLGGTLYYCLTGRPPFDKGTAAEKVGFHQTREPDPVYKFRPEIPLKLVLVVNKMIAKDPSRRYQTPAEVIAALAPWAKAPDAPPPPNVRPAFSPAANNVGLPTAPPEPPPTDEMSTVGLPNPLSAPPPPVRTTASSHSATRVSPSKSRIVGPAAGSQASRAVAWAVLLACVAASVVGGWWLSNRPFAPKAPETFKAPK